MIQIWISLIVTIATAIVYRSASLSSSFINELCISLIVYRWALNQPHRHHSLSMSSAGVSLLGLAWAPPWPRFSRNQNLLHFPFTINHSSLNITIHHPPFNITTLIPFIDASLKIPIHNHHYHSTSIICIIQGICLCLIRWSHQKFHFDLPKQDSAEELLAERDSMIRQLQETVLQHNYHHRI